MCGGGGGFGFADFIFFMQECIFQHGHLIKVFGHMHVLSTEISCAGPNTAADKWIQGKSYAFIFFYFCIICWSDTRLECALSIH